MAVKNDYLSARAAELARRADENEYSFVFSKFLSPAEQIEFFTSLRGEGDRVRHRLFFYGGCREAARRAAVFLPSYIEREGTPFSDTRSIFDTEAERELQSLTEGYSLSEICGAVALEVRGSGFVVLSHRDYMGSLLGLGLERDVVGDIAVTGEHMAVVFVSENVAGFVCDSLRKIGRDTVSCSPVTLTADFVPPREFAAMNVVAASERADSVVAALTGMSRSEAKDACLSDLVEINYQLCRGADMRLSQGDTVSVRGYGKYIIDAFGGETRSGRLRLAARKYM